MRWPIADELPGELTLSFRDNERLREVAGELGAHLDVLANELSVSVTQRGADVRLRGDPRRVDTARAALEGLYALVGAGLSLRPPDVVHVARLLVSSPGLDVVGWFRDAVGTTVDGRPIVPRTIGQKSYVDALRSHDITFGVGPAGTGKTWLAVAAAVAALKRGEVRRLILTRPAVEAGEKLGFLPGDLAEKVDPYLRPLFDALQDMVPADRFHKMLEKRIVEVAPLAFMRGRTLDGAAVVLDEAQNTTKEQMKMFLTRLGHGSKMVINGDPTQIDLPPKVRSGLLDALEIVPGIPGIGVVHLSDADVVRHPVVAALVRAYARRDATAGS